MLSNYINLPVFFASFILGLFFVYMLGPETKPIYVYPTLDNYKNIQYKDHANQCFEYEPVKTNCPINPLSIKTIPIQN